MLTDSTKWTTNYFWSMIMFITGMVMIMNQCIGFDFAVMPGGSIDGRFNNYILEHGYRYLSGQVDSYWNAPFFFPGKNVIAYSDNLLGAMPIYALCRLFVDRETAFQCWYLILIALNFWMAYYALKKLDVSNYAASVGAFIYAFSTIIFIQTVHIQLLPRFLIPISIVFFYMWLQHKKSNFFYISIFLLACQFYAGIYLGYFLMYTLAVMFGVYVVRERSMAVFFYLFNGISTTIKTLCFLAGVSVFMGLLMYPYFLRSLDADAYFSIDEINGYTPRLWCYLFVHETSVFWGWSSTIIKEIFVTDQSVGVKFFLFIGIIPYVFTVLAIVRYRKDQTVAFFMIALLVLSLVILTNFGFSLYSYLLYIIPGAKAIRVVSRFIVVSLFLWSVITALSLDRLLTDMKTYKTLLIFSIPFLLIVDNLNTSNNKKCLKKDFQHRCAFIEDLYKKQKNSNPDAVAFTLCYDVAEKDSLSYKQLKELVDTHIDVMMASQNIGLPCVDGYSGKAPDGYVKFFMQPDEKKLDRWLHKNSKTEKYTLQDILILHK